MLRVCVAVLLSTAGAASIAHGSDFAVTVVEYVQGAGVSIGNDDPNAALGSPTRFTGAQIGFPGAVTPFNPSFDRGECVSIGRGGSLTLAFDRDVIDNPDNPFGLDLIVFGNSFFWDPVNFTATAQALSSDGGVISVSADGQTWVTAPGMADGLFPTLAYLDQTYPFGGPAGSVLSDFTRPVNPNFASPGAWQGADLAAIIAMYDGSGGGWGVDIGALGLSSVRYVRFTNASDAVLIPEIDAVSIVRAVPAPGGVGAAAIAALCVIRRRR
jgi:hypothetical protein